VRQLRVEIDAALKGGAETARRSATGD
jgi:hypothetical protein